jgi:perosamine synthetase
MWSRKRFDIPWSHLLWAMFRILFPPKSGELARRVETLWPDAGQSFACFSVRTGFDLVLQSLNLPPGSEVLVSAITISHMVRILEGHGLVPVPVDLDPRTMAPTAEAWRQAVTPATRAILTAHLFGGRNDIKPVLEVARRHKLYVFEDCAQAFNGLDYFGHPEADVSMFSFGMIKSTTALAGAVLRVRDPDLLQQIRTAQAAYPRQSRADLARRLAKVAVLKFLTFRPITSLFVALSRMFGRDYDAWVNRAVRGFPGADLFVKIRRQPSAPLLALMERRFRRFDADRWQRHAAKGRKLVELLQKAALCPSADSRPHNFWVFPISVDEPSRLIKHLVRNGFDATQGASLCVVPPPAGQPEQKASRAEEILAKLVFLPFYPELTAQASEQMAQAVLEILGSPILPEKPALHAAQSACRCSRTAT